MSVVLWYGRLMDRTARFFEIIQCLRTAHEPVTAQHLADVLEVTPRTVYRDIAALQASKIPISGEAGIGYIMRPGYDLPPLMFAAEELEAISVGLALLGRTNDQRLDAAATTVLNKISQMLPDGHDRSAPLYASDWHEMPEGKFQPSLFRQFIRDAAELEIVYRDEKDVETSRVVQPIAMIYYIEAIILVAWCQLRNGFRHFRIDRIMACVPTGAEFSAELPDLQSKWEKEGTRTNRYNADT